MKLTLVILLVVLAVVLGSGVYFLQKDLLGASQKAAFYEKRSDDLQRELARLSRICDEQGRFLDEIEQNIAELESKLRLETLERYVPKKTWSEISPVIDRIQALQRTREKNILNGSIEK